MTGMTPDEFFEGFVLEDYQDWKDDPYSIRKAFHAAVSAFHLADHHFRYHSRRNQAFSREYKELKHFQANLTHSTPSFKVIQDMANAYKHLYTRAACSVASGGAIESVTYDGETIEGDWEDDNPECIGGIVIRRRDSSVVWFADAIDDVIAMWRVVINECDESAV